MAPTSTTRFLELEARSLLTRLDRILPFSVTLPAVAEPMFARRSVFPCLYGKKTT